MKCALLLDVVVGKGTAILKLFTRKDQTLLIRRDTLLILNLCLDIINGVRRLDLEGDRLARQSLDKDLHASTETQDYIQEMHRNSIR